MSAKKKKDTKLTQRVEKLKAIAINENAGYRDTLDGLCRTIKDKQKKKSIEKQDYTDILTGYKRLIGQLDRDIKNEERSDINADNEKIKNRRKLRKLLAKDFKVFYESSLNPSKDKKLDDIFEESRAVNKTVDISEIKKSEGGGQHVRLILPHGDKKVYFTQSEPTEEFGNRFHKILADVKSEFGKEASFLNKPAVKQAIKSLTLIYGENLRGTKDRLLYKTNKEVMDDFIKAMTDKNKPAKEIEALNEIKKPAQFMAFIEVLNRSGQALLADSQRMETKMKTGVKQEKRNSAMSMVADMLGCGNVIARSRNMNITVTENGDVKKVIKGTAMDEATGDDLYKVSYQSDFFNKFTKKSLENNDRLVVQIADMQVLDYICGNSDRHTANIMYTFDENGKLSIQGIDNDTSFIPFVQGFNGFKGANIGPGQMKIISEKTAEKISNIKEEDFRFMLYGFDLSSEEVDCAIERLKNMKEIIKDSKEFYKNKKEGFIDEIENMPRIVSDENIGKYDFKQDLAFKKGSRSEAGAYHQNLFSILSDDVDELRERGLGNNAATLIGRSRVHLVGTGIAKMDALSTKQESLMHWYTTGSPEYTAVNKAVNDFKEFQAKMKGDFFVKEGKTATLSKEVNELKEQLEKIKGLTKIYLDGKVNDKKKDKKGSRAWNRYNAIRDIDREVKKQLKAIEDLKEGTEAYNDLLTDKVKKPNRPVMRDKNPGIVRDANGVLVENIRVDNSVVKKTDPETVKLGTDEMLNSYNFIGGGGEIRDANDRKHFINTHLKVNIARGLVNAEGKKFSEIEKNPEEFEAYKKALASLVLKSAYDGSFKKGTADNKAVKQSLGKICKFNEAMTADKVKNMVDGVMKTDGFKKMLDNLRKEDKVLAEIGSVGKYMADANKPFENSWTGPVSTAFLTAQKSVNKSAKL